MGLALGLIALLAAPPAAQPAPLPAAAAEAFAAVRADAPPAEIVRNSHYWVSNEYRHDLFKPHLTDLGGVFIGVGTDQNYLMAGWSKPEMLVLMDFDTAIPRLHRAYRHAFAQSETPEAFLAFWANDDISAVVDHLRTTYGDGKDGKRTVKAFKVARKIVLRRLRRTKRSYAKRGVPTFLDDPAQYAYVRGLWSAGRVLAIRGDLTANQTMVDLGKAAKAAGMIVRVVYMSNAPQYFGFDAQFKANIAALPMDDKSVFVHTLTRGAFGYADKYYHYNVQPGLNFLAWLQGTRLKKLTQFLRYRTVTKTPGFSIMEQGPEAAPERHRIKR